MEVSSNHLGDEPRDPSKNAKRSCNNCRQQKLKCDAVQSPFKACSRCRRLQKECKVEGGFRRVGKRDKYTAMQCEIDDLRRQLQAATQNNPSNGLQVLAEAAIPKEAQQIGNTKPREMGDVKLSGKSVEKLFKEYFTHYHPYLPFLDPDLAPDQYFDWSPLLGWTIIVVAARRFRQEPGLFGDLSPSYNKLLWSTISEHPQPYHVSKALCLICTWPLPSTSNPSDATYPLCGMMISIALSNILDFPVHLQFSKGRITEAEQRDRRLTWAACNIVCQCTSSAYGFPSQVNFDRLLGSNFAILAPYHIPKDLLDQLRVTQLYNALGKSLYESVSDPSGLPLEDDRAVIYSQVKASYEEVKSTLGSKISMNTEIMLLAASVQFEAFAFFIPPSSAREAAFVNLYNAACTFIGKVMDFETIHGIVLEHCTNIILQSIFSAVIVLVKLLHSSFANSINVEHGKALYNAAILAVRRMSLRNDDVCARMAVRTPQIAKDMSPGGYWESADPLDLKIRARMCVNHQYDAMWHWLTARRQEMQNRESTNAVAPQGSSAQPETELSQPAVPLDLTAAPGLIGDGFDLFNSMDWLLGDFACGPYFFTDQNSLV
ncbi:uncharacterized protein LY89DRAFT_586780 [Mollisia scopiformis]|uniref:Zn(2)-C6 fungal-type domain-containing protein n=1 Tax=Mollisia scopiformis TaxID=149040 RepID=A0A194X914_MOLSC|nr:uncharacterized protein LY89DRAFT_586780 [Mollisia scopiformis]KUJ16604.1 hypothetical protein LY89DRAFT_586780 [Mollisia scopiformis]